MFLHGYHCVSGQLFHPFWLSELAYDRVKQRDILLTKALALVKCPYELGPAASNTLMKNCDTLKSLGKAPVAIIY
jgi:hypothetical protein